MKGLIKIAGMSSLFFMGAAILQEWDYFSSAWFGMTIPREQITPELDEAERCLRRYLSIMGHFYSSGGDARFLDRMPAEPHVTAEVKDDVVYLRHRHRVLRPSLMRLEILRRRALAPGQVEIATKEYWVFREGWSGGVKAGHEGVAVPQISHSKYRIARSASQWRVAAWEFERPPGPERISGPAGVGAGGSDGT